MGDRLYQDMVKAANPYSEAQLADPGKLRRAILRDTHAEAAGRAMSAPEVVYKSRYGPGAQLELAIEKAVVGHPMTRMEATKGFYEAKELAKMPSPPMIRRTIAEGGEAAARAAGKGPKHSALAYALGIPIAAAVTIGGTTGLAGAAWAGKKLYNAMTYKNDYENMLKQAPEIRNFDTKEVKARFDTLRRFNPQMSKDPLVASSWIKQTIEFPVVTPSTLRDVVQTAPQENRLVDFSKLIPKVTASDIAGGFPSG
jgi:hypothetical protein